MPLFKICSNDLLTKKLVVADSLTELIQKGVKKLSLPETATIQVVLEKDGTDIEEDEELLLLSSSEVLMFLSSGQKWRDFSTQPSENVSNNSNQPGESGDFPFPPHNMTSINTRSDEIYSEIITLPLPKYSSIITTGGVSVDKLWRPLVNETATYYFNKYPKIGESCQYKAISQKVLKEYPCIGLTGGAHPWSSFSKSVAQKVRHIRHNLMRCKSIDATESVKTPKFIPVSDAVMVDQDLEQGDSSEDQARHQQELVKEWAKQKKDINHIKLLIRKTNQYFRELLKKHPGGQIAPILKEFPCFSEDELIIYKLSLKIGSKKVERMSDNMNTLFLAAEKMIGEDHCEIDMRRGVEVIQFIETATKFDKPSNSKTKGHKTKTVLSVLKNPDEMAIKKFLTTVDREALTIRIIEIDDEVVSIHLCGDGCSISCSIANGVWGALKTLMASYYIFDANFPRQYAMLLGILQHTVYEEPYTSSTSQRYKFFLNKVKSEMDTLTK